MQRLFIYGTLKRGLSNSGYMAGQTFVGEARTQPVYRLLSMGDYPGLVPVEENGSAVRGEIWEVDAACREKLDELEGVAEGMYELVPVQLQPPFHKAVVMTYLYRWPAGGFPDAGEAWVEA